MFKKLLVPLDESDLANNIAENALGIAKRYDAEICIIYVIPPIPSYMTRYHGKVETAYKEIQNLIENSANDRMKAVAEQYGNRGIKVDTKVLKGNPADEICKEAKEGEYDLVVIGSRGIGDIKGFFLGSVSNKVVKQAPCPVLVIR